MKYDPSFAVGRETYKTRLRLGWEPERAATTPPMSNSQSGKLNSSSSWRSTGGGMGPLSKPGRRRG